MFAIKNVTDPQTPTTPAPKTKAANAKSKAAPKTKAGPGCPPSTVAQAKPKSKQTTTNNLKKVCCDMKVLEHLPSAAGSSLMR